MNIFRILRILPTYAFCLLVYYKLSVYWGGGPFWNKYISEAEHCDGYLYRNLLFINNLFKKDSCFGWGWYLANDM